MYVCVQTEFNMHAVHPIPQVGIWRRVCACSRVGGGGLLTPLSHEPCSRRPTPNSRSTATLLNRYITKKNKKSFILLLKYILKLVMCVGCPETRCDVEQTFQSDFKIVFVFISRQRDEESALRRCSTLCLCLPRQR